jgi:hypothetical protein
MTPTPPELPPLPTATAACEECGFLLTGHDPRQIVPRCPECGTAFDSTRPWTPAVLPSLQGVLLRSCGPLAASLLLLIALSAHWFTRDFLVWPFLLLGWLPTVFGLAYVLPPAWTIATVSADAPRIERKKLAWRWLVPALAINTALLAAACVAFFLML